MGCELPRVPGQKPGALFVCPPMRRANYLAQRIGFFPARLTIRHRQENMGSELLNQSCFESNAAQQGAQTGRLRRRFA